MVTIRDVARQCGVAPMTVSRVVNDSGYVAREVRERVEAAIAELGYVPNRVARSLRSRRTHTLALVLSDITNPFFTTVARGVEDAASAAGYMVVFCNTDERPDEEQRYVKLVLQQQVDGLLLVPARGAGEAVAAAARQGTPVVVLDRWPGDVAVDVVRCDSAGGAYRLGRLLAELGHRHVAILAGPEGVATSDDRVRGGLAALDAGGVAVRVLRGELTPAGGADLARQALAAAPRPTALLATNNFLTIGALKALGELGCRVPDDVAVVGFDDLPAAMVAFPFLTVVEQPAYAMGQEAVRLLLERLGDGAAAPVHEIVLPTEVVVRQSSGGPRAAAGEESDR